MPEELKEEPLGRTLVAICKNSCRTYLLPDLITRVFYRLRFLSEQTPFDGATFSYAFPLLQFVFSEGGIATEEAEEALEQVALALDIVKFHIGQCTLFLPLFLCFYSISALQSPIFHSRGRRQWNDYFTSFDNSPS